MLRSCFALAWLALFALAAVPAAHAQVRLDDAFPDLPNFDRPVDLQTAPDGTRWVVVEQGGVVTTFEADPAVSERDTLIDLSEVVMDIVPSWEEGLLGLAFHPGYADNGYFYVYYNTFPATEGGPHRSIVSRFTAAGTPPVADPASELVLLDIEQPFPWHNGGQLAFHPLEGEANLYVALGDGGSSGDPLEHAQNRATLLGSILRLDVDNPANGMNYGIPSDNPFVGNVEGWREEIWAYGLRNPWRFSIDPVSGDLWVGDVGQNAWEEVTRVTEAGANLGWDVKEAIFCYEAPGPGEPPCGSPDLLDPIWWYQHEDGNNSVSGGRVYRGDAIPELAGQYVYGDFVSGRIWALDFDGLDEPVNTEIGRLTHVSAFGEDADGELYMASFDNTVRAGRIYRLTRAPVAAEPGAVPSAAPSLRLAGPNPFRAETALTFALAEAGPARLAVYDVLGREVAVLHDGPAPAEAQTVRLAAGAFPAGVYVVRLESGNGSVAQRVTVLR